MDVPSRRRWPTGLPLAGIRFKKQRREQPESRESPGDDFGKFHVRQSRRGRSRLERSALSVIPPTTCRRDQGKSSILRISLMSSWFAVATVPNK